MVNQLSPHIILGIITAYFFALMAVAHFTSKDTSNSSFFLANRRSPWYVVSFGMIGATISGVTFVSVPGWVGASQFSYMQMVLGYLVGYFVIATVLLPMYYRMELTSIYTYLEQRFGFYSYKTGAFYFLLSRFIGTAFRLYLVVIILHEFVMSHYGIPFGVTAVLSVLLIWVYTYRGGVRTIIWTDTLQAACFLLAVFFTVIFLANKMDLTFSNMFSVLKNSGYTKTFFFENGWSDPNNFFKRFLAGAFIAIVMTGLDQDMMQKNLTCRSLKDAQKNMFTYSLALVPINLLFLTLGALLFLYASTSGIAIPPSSDQLYPTIALQYLPPFIGILFILGLVAAAYSSADSALAALTTSICVDFLNFEKATTPDEIAKQPKLRKRVHLACAGITVLIMLLFRAINDKAIIEQIFNVASYTYGPLLGLFAFGFFTKFKINDKFAPLVCLLSPILTYIFNIYSEKIFFGYKFGFELLLLNGLITFLGLFAISYYDYHLEHVEEE